ncbi:MAG: alpha/beta hydrolase family protein [Candidatus Saccharimonadales bacterium]
MKETEVKIPLSDTKLNIYGTLRGDYKHPLIVLCHGYGGWMHEMLVYNAARYFEKEGFASLRLSMYGGGEKSRNISDSDVMTHASDIDDVVAFVKKAGADWVGVAGHSYSGMAIVYSKKQQFDAAALWDPTHTDGYDEPQNKKNLAEDFIFVKDLNAYVSGLGSGYVYAKTVFDNNYPKSQGTCLKFKINTCVFNASWSKEQQRYGKDYTDSIDAKTKQVIIPDSSHPFTEDGAAEKLYAATAEYFKGLRIK